jgi:pantoate kinase
MVSPVDRAKSLANGGKWQVVAEISGKLTRKQEEVIVALLSQRNVEEAARVTKIGSRTIYRWLKDPAFDRAFRESKRATFSQAIARLHQMSSAAVSTLGKVMVDANTPASTKVRAADSILNHTIKAIENEEIEARLSELERAAEASKPPRR